ncbi:hypothetical protein Zmor_019220 [Zophobas morio]|uniref:Uncharacterized protein n=1 Tax=Zophobas morio TaxID=2755281 RepID=A0AA38I369_9CUCU|nr:hypothetical protein Zmor_019220 [Zophobas morio]
MAKSYATHGVLGRDVRVVLVRVGRAPGPGPTPFHQWPILNPCCRRTTLNTLLFFRHLLITCFGVPLRAIKDGRGHARGWRRTGGLGRGEKSLYG